MRAFGQKNGFGWLALAGLLCSSAVPSCIFADEMDTSAQPATTETPKASEPEQAPAASEAQSNQEPQRRALPAPLDGVFPGSDYLGPTPLIGVPDTDPVYPLTKAIWSIVPAFKDARIKVYGWINPGISVSTSNKSNIPASYPIVPNKAQQNQA